MLVAGIKNLSLSPDLRNFSHRAAGSTREAAGGSGYAKRAAAKRRRVRPSPLRSLHLRMSCNPLFRDATHEREPPRMLLPRYFRENVRMSARNKLKFQLNNLQINNQTFYRAREAHTGNPYACCEDSARFLLKSHTSSQKQSLLHITHSKLVGFFQSKSFCLLIILLAHLFDICACTMKSVIDVPNLYRWYGRNMHPQRLNSGLYSESLIRNSLARTL